MLFFEEVLPGLSSAAFCNTSSSKVWELGSEWFSPKRMTFLGLFLMAISRFCIKLALFSGCPLPWKKTGSLNVLIILLLRIFKPFILGQIQIMVKVSHVKIEIQIPHCFPMPNLFKPTWFHNQIIDICPKILFLMQTTQFPRKRHFFICFSCVIPDRIISIFVMIRHTDYGFSGLSPSDVVILASPVSTIFKEYEVRIFWNNLIKQKFQKNLK